MKKLHIENIIILNSSMKNTYEYNVTIAKVVDGDTVDVDIDLGFGMVYKKQRVRMLGIDTPESRTRDLVEKKFGKASKKHLKELLESAESITLISHDKGKFGRILGELFVHEEGIKVNVNEQMITDHHAVPYTGENKDLVEEQHMANREVLLANATVVLDD